MWWPSLVVCLLLLSAVHSYKSGFYASGGRYGKRILPIARRDTRSGIFWTGSRYNRRGSDMSGIKVIRKGSDNFFMGSRYGKRADGEIQQNFDKDLCKFNSYHPFCSNR